MRILMILLVMIFICASGYSATWYVPDDYITIQDAIDAASFGDTIIVRPGTYVENIDFLGKDIVVKSEHGAGSAIIDGGNPSDPDFGSVAMFQSGESQGAVLEGFTIRNGSGLKYSMYPNFYCWGGGIFCSGSSPTIKCNVICDNKIYNTGSNYGAGIFCEDSSPVIVNNLIFDNEAVCNSTTWGNGGGICCDAQSHPIITNTTITNNSAACGGGIFCEAGSNPIITNNILWNNMGLYDPGYFNEIFSGTTGLELTYCLIKNGSEESWFGEGCIDPNPYFLDPCTKDLHIVNFSPCRNAGNNNAPGIQTEDFEGDDRILEGTVDIGADEFSTPHGSSDTYYIPGDFNTIQEAIDSAFPHDTFIVEPGTYMEEISFNGKAITLKSEFGPEVTKIVGNNQDETLVCFEEGEGEDSVLEGFTIQEGSSGIRCVNSSPTIINNIIRENQKGLYGSWDCTPMIIGNTINNNSKGIFCGYYGGAPLIKNNLISDNHEGGIYCNNSNAIITGNIIQGNSAEHGGGIDIEGSSDEEITVSNNIIFNNSAEFGGGINCNGRAMIINNTLFKNTATGYPSGPGEDWGGGGICCTNAYPVTITNTILWGNSSAPKTGPQIALKNGSILTISHSDVEGGYDAVYIDNYPQPTLNWGRGMIDFDPVFLDPLNDDYHLTCASPCIDAGDNDAPLLPDSDIEGDPRIFPGNGKGYLVGLSPSGDIVDMGADEYCLLKRQELK